MQINKEHIKSAILNAARIEFFKKGFKRASMRNISSISSISTSNIYNYYKNKDELLEKVSNTNIELKNIEFSYHNTKVIYGISLSIPSQSLVAFVGASGSGKTTLTYSNCTATIS